MAWQQHREEILQSLSALPGDIGFWLEDTSTGETLSYQPHLPIEAASVIKLTVMAEAFRQRESGEMDFQRMVTIRSEDKLPSCGALTYLHDGLQVTVGDLVTLMIILSDNTATNLLIGMLGQEAINAEIQRLGLKDTQLNRMLFRPELAAQGIQNYVSAADMGRLLRLIWQDKCVSPAADARMRQILRDQRLNGKMPFYLHSEGVACAHKTGEDDSITHDVGVIERNPPVIFCFLSQRTDVPRAERTLQEIARLVGLD